MTDVAQGMAALRALIAEGPGTDVTVERGPVEEQLRDIQLLHVDYRYTWEGRTVPHPRTSRTPAIGARTSPGGC